MKILHLYRDIMGPSGVPYEVRQLAEHQASLGHDVVAAFRLRGSHENKNATLLGLEGGLQGLTKLRRVLRDFKPDIAHVTGLWIPAHNFWIREVWRANIPYVCEPHGNLNPIVQKVRFGNKPNSPLRTQSKRMFRYLFDMPLLRQASGMRLLSNHERALVIELGLQRPFVVPSAIDEEWFNPCDNERRVSNGAIRMLYLGRLDFYQKGFDLLLEAFEILKNKGRNQEFEVRFVGPTVGDSTSRLDQEIRSRGLSNVSISGGVYGDAKHQLFATTDLFLHPSRFEGFAKTAREAVAHGVPVLSSYEGNFGDWVASEEMGLVTQLNSADIARQIESILGQDGRERLQSMSRRALQFARRTSWEMVAGEVVNHYQNILSKLSFKT